MNASPWIKRTTAILTLMAGISYAIYRARYVLHGSLSFTASWFPIAELHCYSHGDRRPGSLHDIRAPFPTDFRNRHKGVTEPFIYIPAEGRLESKEIEAIIESVLYSHTTSPGTSAAPSPRHGRSVHSGSLATTSHRSSTSSTSSSSSSSSPVIGGIGPTSASSSSAISSASTPASTSVANEKSLATEKSTLGSVMCTFADWYQTTAAFLGVGSSSGADDEDDSLYDNRLSASSTAASSRRHSILSRRNIEIHEPDVPRILYVLISMAQRRAVTVLRRLLGSVGETDERVLSRSTRDVEDEFAAQLHGPCFATICDKFVKALPWRDGCVRIQDFARTFESAAHGPVHRSPQTNSMNLPFAW